jgi:hypothetical protein
MIQDKIKSLLEAREEVRVSEEYLNGLRDKRNAIQEEIKTEMKELGFSTVKAGDTSVAIAHRKTFKIVDEKQVIEFIKSKKLGKEYLSERLNEYAPKALEQMSKEEEIKGTEIQDTEYVSIRTKKEKE